MEREIKEIFERITEHHSIPLRIGSRCEAHTYYRIEDLGSDDIELCAGYIAERIYKVCQEQSPDILISLPGSYTGLGPELAKALSTTSESLPLLELDKINITAKKAELKGKKVLLINDVITTARSCLEAHTKVTMSGAYILSWVALIDRTFGPGPVPVIAAFTGEPVVLLEEIS